MTKRKMKALPAPILSPEEERFLRLAEGLDAYVFVLDLTEMKSVFFNRSEFVGYSREELLASGAALRAVHEEDAAAVRAFSQSLGQLPPGEQAVIEYRLQNRMGGWEWVRHQVFGLAYGVDGPTQLLIVLNLLTEQRERELSHLALQSDTAAASERRRRQVQISTQIAQDIIAIADLDVLYRRVVNLIKEQFGYYHVQLLRHDPAANALVLAAGYGEVGDKMLAAGHKMAMGVGLIGTAAASGRPALSSNTAADPNWRSNPLLPETRGELAAPIQFGAELLGALDVQSDTAGSLDTEDVALLEGLCGQIAIAIESARLRQATNEQLDELNRLQRFMSHEGWRAYQATAVEGLTGYLFDQSDVAPLSTDLLTEWTAGETLSPSSNGLAHVVPLAVRGASIGVLGLENDPLRPLTDEDEALLESIATQVSEALETARLLEQTQKRAVELETVARVGAAASTLLQTEKLLKTVVDLAQSRFGLYNVSIFVLEEGDEAAVLRLAAASGERGERMAAEQVVIPLAQMQSLVARAARTREPVVVNDVSQEPEFMSHPLLPETRSELTLPLLVGDRLLGVMGVQADRPNQFGGDDVRIQQTLAAQIAIALQNANLYAEQLETTAKLREVDRLKSEFLASMSHELRTPLNSIIGFADVMLEGIDGPLNERMTEDITFIRDSGRHLRELIGEILDMSKIEAGMMELRYNKVDPKRLAKDVMAAASGLRQNKAIELRLNIDPDTEIIQADEMRLRQVLYNLMSNAVKFTEQGYVALHMKTTDEKLLVSVEDTGIGIHPEDVPIVFEQFRQVDGSLTRKVGGTGLGMPISKSLIELHGGQMGVDSVPGKGSAFWFTIPKVQPTPAVKSDTGPLRPGTGPLRLGPPK